MQLTQEQETLLESIRDIVKQFAPVSNVSLGHLAFDPNNLRVYIKLSLDPRDTWKNGIYENSRNASFAIEINGGNITKFSGCSTSKFRACKYKNLDNLNAKLLAWFEQSKNPTI